MNTTAVTANTPMQIRALNVLLARELGYTPYGDPIFKFEWTEDLFWPLYKTGKLVAEPVRYEVPLLGVGDGEPATQLVDEHKIVPEYVRERMTHKYKDQWIITSWIPAEGLAQWMANFQGADFPTQGYRICTNYVIPRGDVPNIDDVQRFCAGVRFNRSFSETALAQKFNDEYDEMHPAPATHPDEYNFNSEIGAAVAENFNAFMNPTPGKRGGSVSVGGVGENPVLKRKKESSEPLVVLAKD